MDHRLAQAPLPDVVDAVLAAPSDDGWALLDLRLRTTLLRLLRDGVGELELLAASLLRAADAAPPPWDVRWEWALELVREAREGNGLAEQVQFIGANERAAEVLLAVGLEGLRPRSEVLEALGISEQHLTGLLGRLVSAGLLERTRAGRQRWLQLTPRGRTLVRVLAPAAVPRLVAPRTAPPSWLAATPAWGRKGSFLDEARMLQAVA